MTPTPRTPSRPRDPKRATRADRPSTRPRAAVGPAVTPFDAIADPTRRAILDGLSAAPEGRTVKDIAAAFPVSRPAISKHLLVLRRAALVHERKEGRRRFYTLSPRPLAEVDAWLARYRLRWAGALIDLKDLLEQDRG